jgi:hypothetical protein
LGFHALIKEDDPQSFSIMPVRSLLVSFEELAKDINEMEPPKKNGFPVLHSLIMLNQLKKWMMINRAEKKGEQSKSPQMFLGRIQRIFSNPMVTIGSYVFEGLEFR